MKYGNECESREAVCCGESQSIREPMEHMTEVLHSTSELGLVALETAKRISGHLFGFVRPTDREKEAAPDCFRAELNDHRKTLSYLVDELKCIADQLGA